VREAFSEAFGALPATIDNQLRFVQQYRAMKHKSKKPYGTIGIRPDPEQREMMRRLRELNPRESWASFWRGGCKMFFPIRLRELQLREKTLKDITDSLH
jgi:hypothetical protein